MTRRILITGATGFVGGHLCRSLAARGDAITVVSRDAARARKQVPSASDAVSAGPDGTIAMGGVDAIVNLAGEPVAGRWTRAKREAIETSRIEGTRRLVRSIAKLDAASRPKVLVSASAIGLYGDRGEETLDESSPAGSDFLAKVCLGWEREAAAARELGVRVVPIRIGLVMGRDGGALQAMQPLFKAGLGGPLGSGQQWWPWIHIDDLIGLLLFALDRDDLDGPINATAPTPVRQREHARVLGAVLHRPAFLPALAFALRTMLGDFSVELLASRRVIPKRARELGYAFVYPELEPALASLYPR
jgi:uncharacterized protein (TIGR01777 family)